VRALGKKKVETAKAVVPQGKVATPPGNTATRQGKGVLKRPSNMEVTPERPIKQIKKVMSRLAATTTTTGVAARASGSKVVVGKKKDCGACSEASCSCYWCYSGGVFDRFIGVFASRPGGSGLDARHSVEAGASWLLSSGLCV
jgi:hypothetical protein